MTLCNLTSDKANQEHLVKQGGLPPLIRLAGSPDPDCARYAGMALCNLAASRANRVPIAKAGALPPLVEMASSPRLEV